jgi:predicted ATPase
METLSLSKNWPSSLYLALTQMGFLAQDPRGYVFNHMLIEDTAFDMINPEDRRALHAKIASVMESSEAIERPERLAWQHQEAGNTKQAIKYWTQASREAIHRAAWSEAATFAGNGLALVEPDAQKTDALELGLLLCKAPA